MSYQFIYSGPLLFKSSLSKEDCLALLKICNNNKKVKYNKNLAGVINEEYKIENLEAVKIILNKYFDEIVIAVSNWYSFSPKQVILKSAWTNYMKAGEFNPPHIHNNCKFSSVFYLQVPEKISKESKNFISTGSKPGDINFLFCPPTPGYVETHIHSPKSGDFFIFPSTLIHSVNPFKTKKIKRISMAINFDIE